MKPAITKQSHLRRWLFCCLSPLLGLLIGCAGEPSPLELSGHTMGTTWHVTYTPSALGEAPAEVQQGIERLLEEVNMSMSTYRPESEISRFNGAQAAQWFSVSPDFFEVLQAAMTIGVASGGAYDVTVGPVVNLWGFGPAAKTDAVPDEKALMALLGRIGQDKLQLDEGQRQILKTTDLSLDFSSIAKGYGVDQVADWLASVGVEDFLVEVGGEMRLQGLSPRGVPWRIAIEQPDATIGSVATAISLSDQAMATSGDYRNYFEVDGKRYSHTIDPRTAYPVQHDLVSVTVVHPRAMIADGWATAFTVMGERAAMKVALEQDLAVYFIRHNQGQFISSHSPQFGRYLETVQ